MFLKIITQIAPCVNAHEPGYKTGSDTSHGMAQMRKTLKLDIYFVGINFNTLCRPGTSGEPVYTSRANTICKLFAMDPLFIGGVMT